MINAREEFESQTKDLTVLCAWIQIEREYGEVDVDAVLQKGYSDSEYQEFLKELNVEYDSGYGTQELFGIIWLDNGEWFCRHEYDGSEGWTHQSRPEIPEKCGGEDSAVKAVSKG